MRKRLRAIYRALPDLSSALCHAVRESFAEGYGARAFRGDLASGLIVGVVALPLSMALAIAVGAPPQHGLYTAIVAGIVAAVFGGSRVQVTGPTAAFVVILAPIVHQHGVGGLLVATAMAGCFLVVFGLAGMGRLIEFVPFPVTTGFTTGIALVIATLQVKDFLGLSVPHMPEHYIERVGALAGALPTMRWSDAGVGAATLAILVLWPRVTRRVPAPVVALAAAPIGAAVLARTVDGFSVATIESRFGGIPRALPSPQFPWSYPDETGASMRFGLPLVREMLFPAFAIAMLGAIESLLSAVIADGMTGFKHDPDDELVAQGLANVAAPFFGGIAATGALARTATNVRFGGRTPVAAVVHSVFILGAMLLFAPLLGYLPMASLAALLLVVAWNMSELKHFAYVARIGPAGDVATLLVCFGLTVVFDMMVAVSVGVVLAALLFMRRMAELTQARLVGEGHPLAATKLPEGVIVYEIAGPLFFGAAQRALGTIDQLADHVKVVVLDMSDVPAMDATGLVNLESTLNRLKRDGARAILAGVRPNIADTIHDAGWVENGFLTLCGEFDEAVDKARVLAGKE